MSYNPDRWVILKVKDHYRVLAGWDGGYLSGSSWRLNSGIIECKFDGEYWYFYGSSGSTYKCYVDSYGFNMSIAGAYSKLKEIHGDDVEMLEDQVWIKDGWDWGIQ